MKLRSQIALLILTVLLGTGATAHYYGVLVPLRRHFFQLSNAEPGNWSDLYPRWLGTRELLLHGRTPYSLEITREIQRGFYGRALDPKNPTDPADREAFAYPAYIAFLLAPFVGFPFESVRTAAALVLPLLAAASVLLWLHGMRIRLRPYAVAIAVIASLSSYSVLDAIHLQQLTLLVAALLAATFALLASGRLRLAGLCLALATIKPQLVALIVLWLIIWTLGDWRSRSSFILAFAAAMIALVAGAELILPGWFGQWRQAAHVYLGYVSPSLIETFFGRGPGQAASAAGILAAGAVFWRLRQKAPGSERFNFAFVAGLVLTCLLCPNGINAVYTQVLLVPAYLWLFTSGRAERKSSTVACVTWDAAALTLVGQWPLALAVLFAVVVLGYLPQSGTQFFVAAPQVLAWLAPFALLLSMARAVPQWAISKLTEN
jgi:hypothetical protein